LHASWLAINEELSALLKGSGANDQFTVLFLKSSIKELVNFADMGSKVEGSATFMSEMLDLCLIVVQVFCCVNCAQIKQSLSSLDFSKSTLGSAVLLMRRSYQVQHSFLGLSKNAITILMEFRLMANLLYLCFLITDGLEGSIVAISDAMNAAIQTVDFISKIEKKKEYVTRICRVLDKVPALKKSSRLSHLLELIAGFEIPSLGECREVVKRSVACSRVLIDGAGDLTRSVVVPANVPYSIRVEVLLENIGNCGVLKILVKYPNRFAIMHDVKSELCKTGPMKLILRACILIEESPCEGLRTTP